MKQLFRWAAATPLIMASYSHGQVSAYAPLHQSPLLEHHISALMIEAQIPVVKRPLAISKIRQAVVKVCSTKLSNSCQVVRDYLTRFDQSLVVNHARVEVNSDTQSNINTANRRGLAADSQYLASGHAIWQANDWLAVSLGAQIDESATTLEDSYISLGTDWAQLDVGYRPHWFSPFNQSAMILSTQAETMATVSLSNTRPLSFLNFSYELFVGEQSHSDRIHYQGGMTSGKPILTGMHFEISPFSGFSLSANRVMQSGGGERGGRSLSDLLKAFVDPSGSDNTSDELSVDEQFGNQAASLVSRFDFSGSKPFSVYFEYAGEDTSRGSNWRLGNVSLSAGIHIPNLYQNVSLRYEQSHWQNGWYSHHVYGDGLTNEGNIIGHWAAEMRQRENSASGQAIGAKHHYLQLSMADDDSIWQLELSQTNNEKYSQVNYETARQAKLSWFGTVQNFPVQISAATGKNTFGESATSMTVGVHW